MPPEARTNRKGYTAIEATCTMLIVAALSFLFIPKYNSDAIEQQKAEAAAVKLRTDIRRASRYAVTRAGITPDTGRPNEYELYIDDYSADKFYQIIDKRTDPPEIIETVHLDPDISVGGSNNIEFNSEGEHIGDTDKIQISGGGRTWQISISSTGLVKMEEL